LGQGGKVANDLGLIIPGEAMWAGFEFDNDTINGFAMTRTQVVVDCHGQADNSARTIRLSASIRCRAETAN
jgi:hypothetical protein